MTSDGQHGEEAPGGEAEGRVFWALFGASLVALLVPLWGFSLVPLQDLGGHIELMDVMARYDDPSTQYAEVFEPPEGFGPNTLSLWLAALLGPVIGVTTVAKLLLSVYVLGVPLAMLLLLDAFERSRWLVFLMVPCVYGALMNQGFINFLMAFPLLLASLPLARLWAARGDPRHGVALAAVATLAYASHVMVFMILLGMSLTVMLLFTRSARGLLRLLVLTPPLPFFALWVHRLFVAKEATAAGRTFTDDEGGLGLVYNDFSEMVVEFPNWWMVFFKDHSDWVPMGVLMGVWVLLMVVFRARRSAAPAADGGWPRWQAWLQRWSLELITLCCLVAYFVLPSHMNEMALIAERVVLLTMLLLMAWPRHTFTRWTTRAALAPGVALALAWPAWVTWEFHRFEAGFGELPEAIEALPDGTRLFFEMRDIRDPIALRGAAWHIHKGLHALANGGTTNDTFAIRPYTPVQLRAGEAPFYYAAGHLGNETLPRYSGVLIRSDEAPTDLLSKPNLESLYARAPWWLFRRHLPELEPGAVVTAGPDYGVPVAWDCPGETRVAGLMVAGNGALTDVELVCQSRDRSLTKQMGFDVPAYMKTSRCRTRERLVGLHGVLLPAAKTVLRVGALCATTTGGVRALPAVGAARQDGDAEFRITCPEGSSARGFRGRQSTPWHQLGLLCQPE